MPLVNTRARAILSSTATCIVAAIPLSVTMFDFQKLLYPILVHGILQENVFALSISAALLRTMTGSQSSLVKLFGGLNNLEA